MDASNYRKRFTSAERGPNAEAKRLRKKSSPQQDRAAKIAKWKAKKKGENEREQDKGENSKQAKAIQ